MTATVPTTTADGHWEHTHQHRKGFFTDTSVCIGCKACEVACKEWNHNPADGDLELLGSSYDNTGALGANTWRHVAFVEQDKEQIEKARESGRKLVNLGMPGIRVRSDTGSPKAGVEGGSTEHASTSGNGAPGGGMDLLNPAATSAGLSPASTAHLGVDLLRPMEPTDLTGVDTTPPDTADFRWLMSSDVCKHCTHAGCLDVCPTGALFRTEFDTVVVQNDVCNGCGTCVAGCPFGVIERRDDGVVTTPSDRSTPGELPNHGTANKCTMCYDRLVDGQQPACAQTCPTESIKFGDREDMVAKAKARVAELHAKGLTEARLYGANPNDGVGGTGSVFLLLDEPEVYGLPPDPRVATKDLPGMFTTAGIAALGMAAAAGLAFLGSTRS